MKRKPLPGFKLHIMAFVALKKMVQVIPVRSILKSQIVNPNLNLLI